MITTVKRPVKINITHVHISVPVRYEEEDIPNDFPLRKDDLWEALVNIDTGVIENWPGDPRFEQCCLEMKVCDEGTYTLFDHAEKIAAIEQDYVPHGVVPGEYGDYIRLVMDHGRITNWPKKPSVAMFFGKEDDE